MFRKMRGGTWLGKGEKETGRLPSTTACNGLKIYGYWANFDSTQPGGITFTNYVRMIIGSEGFTNPNG